MPPCPDSCTQTGFIIVNSKGRLPAGAENLEQHTRVHVCLVSIVICSFSVLSLAHSFLPLLAPLARSAQKGFPQHLLLVTSSLSHSLPCFVYQGQNATGRIHPPPAAVPVLHDIFLLASMPSTLLPWHLVHQLPPSRLCT